MITYTLLALIVGFSLYCFNNRAALEKYMFYPYAIKHGGEHYRFLTHAFIHADFFHLFFNCFALYGFGIVLEQALFSNADFFDPRIGKVLYLILFTGGIYAASIAEYFRNKDNRAYSSLGASGAVSSVIFYYILVVPQRPIALFFIEMPGWVAGILLLSVSGVLIVRKRKGLHTDNISHEAHFWGALFGIFFEIITRPNNLNDVWAMIADRLG